MPEVNWDDVLDKMIEAAKNVLGANWSAATGTLKPVFESLAKAAADIEAQKIAGTITAEDARDDIAIVKDSLSEAADALKGQGLIAAEEAVNAAIGILGPVLKTATGWTLL